MNHKYLIKNYWKKWLFWLFKIMVYLHHEEIFLCASLRVLLEAFFIALISFCVMQTMFCSAQTLVYSNVLVDCFSFCLAFQQSNNQAVTFQNRKWLRRLNDFSLNWKIIIQRVISLRQIWQGGFIRRSDS